MHLSPAHPAGTGTVTPVQDKDGYARPVVTYNLVGGILQQGPPVGTGTPGTPAEQVLTGTLPMVEVEDDFQDCVSE
jgi:hypothetical protein